MVSALIQRFEKIIHINLLTDPKGKYWRPQDNNFVPFLLLFPTLIQTRPRLNHHSVPL